MMQDKLFAAAVAVIAALSAGAVVNPPVRTDADRNATGLRVDMERIGTLRPKDVREVGESNWTIDGAPVDRDFAEFDKYCDYLPALGVRKIRILTGWAKCEKVRGKIDVAWLDRIVDWCAAHGMEALLELSYGNPIYPGAGGAGLSDGIPNTEEGLAAWDRWVEFLAAHFKGRVREWAMWNEPDNRLEVNTPEMIAAFNVRSAKILKRHMPDCRLHALSLASNDPEVLEACIRPMGEDVKLFDTFIYHGYVANPDCSYPIVEQSKRVLAKYAPHAKLRQGENGAPSEYLDRFALALRPWSEVSQAKYDMRRALGDLGHDVESGLFCIVDINYRPPTFPLFFCNRKGYLRVNASNEVVQVKRAFYAMQNVAGLFNHDLRRVADRGISTTDRTLALFEYRTGGGLPLFVFWNRGPVRVKGFDFNAIKSAEEIEQGVSLEQTAAPGDSFETREETFEWTGAPLEEPVWVDLMTGWTYAVPADRQIVHSGGTTFVRIPAYDSPCVLTERRALDLQGEGAAQTFEIAPAEGNATPRVVAAVKAMRDGDTLRFKKGEYHFYEEGAIVRPVMSGATSWGEKKLVFGFEGKSGITVDGGGSTFVWHGNVFPFSFAKCRGVTVKDFTARAFRPSYVELKIDRYLDDGGFEFTFNPGVAYSVKDGALLIDTDLGRFDSREKIISIHALERIAIHYLFAANETTRRDRLASTFLNGVAEDLGNGRVRIANRRQALKGCLDRFPFKVGEPLCFLLNGRERCSLHFTECRDAAVRNVHLQSGDGMGIVSFLGENLTIDGYRVEPREGEHVSITADCLFVVNNRGLVEVKNSTFSWALDDAINMHGNYLRVASASGATLELEHIHHGYYNFHPYHPGDTVEFTDPESRAVLATARVVSVAARGNGAAIVVEGLDAPLAKGTLVENITWLPEVRLHDNVFHDVLHVRLSGRGKYTVERNVFRRGIALLVSDLAKYWGEAGRTEDMTIRDNLFDSFSSRGWGGSFIVVEVDGRNGRELKIHRGIRIVGNRVTGLPEGVPFVSAPCALDPVIE